MTKQFNAEQSLSKIKERILKLDSTKSDVTELEFLIQNAIEILNENNQSIDQLFHTYYENRIRNFKLVQQFCKSEIPDTDFQIDSIPEEWSTPLVNRDY
ncbi:MAG: hypothetical protein IPJ09_09230 [Saprospiraceae bacterium]|nr:hypothetical protein [Saprospiraceae bacterium]